MFRSSLYFLSREDDYQNVKPYTLRYIPEDIAPTNIVSERREITVHDLRDCRSDLEFERDGFIIHRLRPPISPEVFHSASGIFSIYIRQLSQALQELFKATHVYVLDYSVRRGNPDFPRSSETSDKINHLFPMAHIGQRRFRTWHI